jgi:hypothetical protein
MESLGDLTGHGQVRRVIRVELNDIGARVLNNHPPLQGGRDSLITGT